jgi:hypothetical protein
MLSVSIVSTSNVCVTMMSIIRRFVLFYYDALIIEHDFEIRLLVVTGQLLLRGKLDFSSY